MNRRSLMKQTAVLAGGVLATRSKAAFAELFTSVTSDAAPFSLPALPYAYDALVPYIDAETMHLHHDKHHASYVNALNAAIATQPSLSGKKLHELLANLSAVPESARTAIKNQGGGHANHSFWWPTLSKSGGTAPKGELAKDIDAKFGSFDKFQQDLIKAATSVFGSGWAWLVLGSDKTLQLTTTPNQDSPISGGQSPVLGVDVWEHAYYLKYNNRRPEYLAAFFKVLNWDFLSGQYADAKKAKS